VQSPRNKLEYDRWPRGSAEFWPTDYSHDCQAHWAWGHHRPQKHRSKSMFATGSGILLPLCLFCQPNYLLTTKEGGGSATPEIDAQQINLSAHLPCPAVLQFVSSPKAAAAVDVRGEESGSRRIALLCEKNPIGLPPQHSIILSLQIARRASRDWFYDNFYSQAPKEEPVSAVGCHLPHNPTQAVWGQAPNSRLG
jgi:hypothetical protein